MKLHSVLDRLVTDEQFRERVQSNPDCLGSDFDLLPGESGLLAAVAEAAYGLSADMHFQHRMCAVAA
jgi:hypothetical protein